MAYSGRFMPNKLEKYKGDPRKITYRSSWEHFFMKWLDNNNEVVQWNSEEVVIPYFCNAEGKKRRYFMDFWFKTQDGKQFFIEVKPKKETMAPPKPSKLTTAAKKRYINEVYTWSVNQDKWKAAQATANKMGIIFRVLTEDGLKKLGWRG
ncbi:head completion protein [Serratia phage X20]|uniref:Head completion nuclease n=3 Tax=Winklervirus TaxID=2560256 RepID=A0A1Z1LZA1_9CAUD|nr:head closure [Serratia phage CHI14]YP_010092305.1 head closure [Serratia phage X20]ARW57852.1 head completion protein [Serratia phage CBH8]QYN80599.1 head completion protein [Kosakonia phage Kc304]UJJ22145.1 head completion protein [Erwinia phage Virsaitis27]UYM28806.1 head completion protein [Serratia phage vB_SspM_LC53]ARW57577.1 head completion protein [Serratia phage CHI14]